MFTWTRGLLVVGLGVGALACGESGHDTAAVKLSMTAAAPAAKRVGRAAQPCPEGVTCLTPTELSMKMTAAYVAYDIDPGNHSNVGPSDGSQPDAQAIYASPGCGVVAADDGTQRQPDFAACSIDVGLTSSANPPKTISMSPDYIDLAAGADSLRAALDAGRFEVAVGHYAWLRLDVGSNAPAAPPNGSQDTVAPNTALNWRFFAPGMDAPYQIRRLTGVDVRLEPALELAVGQTVDVTLAYSLEGVVLAVPVDSSLQVDPATCTPPQGDPAVRYCLDVSRLGLEPVISVE